MIKIRSHFTFIKIFMILFFLYPPAIINKNIFSAYAQTGGGGGPGGGTCPLPECCCGASCGPYVGACSNACVCQSDAETGELGAGPATQGPGTVGHDEFELVMYQEWIIKNVWEAHVLPAMMLMAQQMTVSAMQQVQIIGTFFDAKHQLESQRLLQDLQAQAHKNYHPSTGMCRFGTNTRSLALSDRNVEMNQIALAARSTNRILMNSGTIGTGGARDDLTSRLSHFMETYCNPNDFGFANDLFCAATNPDRRNKDINFLQTLHNEDTLLIDFTDTTETNEETDVLALSANLYGSRLLPVIAERHTANKAGEIVINGAKVYMDTRALAAKRSVAFNSYAVQAAMKSAGGDGVTPYITEILEEMGIGTGAINEMLKDAPSYNAQMEILTKKIYQWPNFYSDLYDKPTNIDRKDTSIQAIALMQKRDMYKSQLRSEANTAVWLEIMLEDLESYHGNESNFGANTAIIRNLGL